MALPVRLPGQALQRLGAEGQQHEEGRARARAPAPRRLIARRFTGVMPTVKEFIGRFLAHQKAHTKQLTYELHETICTLHIEPHVGKLRLDQLRRAELEGLKMKWLDAGAAPRTVNTRLGVAVRMLSLAANELGDPRQRPEGQADEDREGPPALPQRARGRRAARGLEGAPAVRRARLVRDDARSGCAPASASASSAACSGATSTGIARCQRAPHRPGPAETSIRTHRRATGRASCR
jgi:hypothetical protein